jgi:branched-chain amino acid transport system substrate-binding protein
MNARNYCKLGVLAFSAWTLFTSAASADFVIGVVNPLTGFGADLGICAQQAIEPLVEEINKAGGINGQKVTVVFRDDESNPQKGVSAVMELLQRHNVNIIVGANLTNTAVAVAPIINQAKIPFLVFGTGNNLTDPARLPYVFRTNFYTDMEAELITHYAISVKGYKAPALIADSAAFGQTGTKAVLAALKKLNVTPAAVETFNPSDNDMTGPVARAQKARADVIIGWSLGAQLAQVARASQRLNFNVEGIGGAGIHQESFIELAGAAGKGWSGTYYRSFTSDDGKPASAKVLSYIKGMQARWGSKLSKTMNIAALWDDTLRLVVDAAKRAKSTRGEDLKIALENTRNFQGMMSNYSFSPEKHEGFDPKDISLAYVLGSDTYIRTLVPGSAEK